jgi:hydroxypyruvate reductase
VAGRVAETPKPGDASLAGVANRVIGSNTLVVEAAAAEAERLGYPPLILTGRLQGEAREVARVVAGVIGEAAAHGRPVGRPGCLIAGGELTVTVRGRGVGGRCQELCLALAPELAGLPGTLVLASGTDGSDGPTESAGAVVDGTSLARARAAGLDVGRALAENDSHRVLDALGDLVVTGPTDTNLMDLYVALLAPAGARGLPASGAGALEASGAVQRGAPS